MKDFISKVAKILFILLFVFVFNQSTFADEVEDDLNCSFPLTKSRTGVSLTVPFGFSVKEAQSSLNDFEPGYSYVLLENVFNRNVVSVDTRTWISNEGVGTGVMCYELEKDMYSAFNPIIVKTANKSVHLLHWDKDMLYHDAFFSDGYRCIKVTSKEDYSNEIRIAKESVSIDIKTELDEEFYNIFVDIMFNSKKEDHIDYLKENIINRKNTFPFQFEIVDYLGRSAQEIYDLTDDAGYEYQYEVERELYNQLIAMDNIDFVLTPDGRSTILAELSGIHSYFTLYIADKGHIERAKEMYWSEIRKFPDVADNYAGLAMAYAGLDDKKHALFNLRKALQIGDYKLGYGIDWFHFNSIYSQDSEYYDFLKKYIPYRLISDLCDGPFIGLNYKGEYIHLDKDTLEPLYEKGFKVIMPFDGDFAKVNGKPGELQETGRGLSSDWYLINKKGEIVKAVDM